jgi:hypothetical protein
MIGRGRVVRCDVTNWPAFGPGTQVATQRLPLTSPVGRWRSLRIMQREKTWPTVLCPACKARMSIGQIITGSFTANEVLYHCPMCDTETKQLPYWSSRKVGLPEVNDVVPGDA